MVLCECDSTDITLSAHSVPIWKCTHKGTKKYGVRKRTRGKKSGDKMFEIDFRSRIPIYEQIKNEILIGIRLGVYKPDEQLPSIRSVSQSTGINVNTIKRAFADLEDEGVIYTLIGRGSFVSASAADNTTIAEKALKEIEQDIRSLKSKGVDKDSLIRLIESVYSEETKND